MGNIDTINLWSVTKQARLVGQFALLRDHPFTFEVEILDVKTSYGATRVEVTPTHGSGLAWVSTERITLAEETLKALGEVG